jgi:flagellar hook-associated protein 1 FlgK
MSDILSIGSSGVSAYQKALATVSNNIANVNTDGYSRQSVQIASNQPTQVGGGYLGTGVNFDSVKRQYDAFIDTNLRNSSSELAAQDPLLTYANRLIDIMGDQSIGLTSALNNFYQSARNLSSDPASTVQRSTFLRDADGLATRFRQLSGQIESLTVETKQAVDTTLGSINSITQQLAQINKQLGKHADVGDQPSELLDQRDVLLKNLADQIGIKTKFSSNGSVLVSVGDTIDQGILVQSDKSRDIGVQLSSNDTNKLEFTIDPYGKRESLPYVTTGKLGGIISFREQVLQPASNALNNLASKVAGQINSIHTQGIDAQGNLGKNLFSFIAGQENKASGIQVAIQDTAQVAAAGQFRITNSPLNTGSAQAQVDYIPPVYLGPTALNGPLLNGLSPAIGIATLQPSMDGVSSLGLVPAGTQDVVITLNQGSSSQSLQVMSRDGVHLLGANLSGAQLTSIMNTSQGMEEGATYSEASSAQVQSSSNYMGMDLFMGYKTGPVHTQVFDAKSGKALPDSVTPAVLSLDSTQLANQISAGSLTLNGVTLAIPAQQTPDLSSPASLANWLNSVTAQATPAVTASVDSNNPAHVLLQANDNSSEIRLGLSGSGTPASLGSLGLATSVYIKGASKDDLLFFATDTSSAGQSPASNFNISSQFGPMSTDLKQSLRTNPLKIDFGQVNPTTNTISYTISVASLNPDGSPVLDSNGKAVFQALAYRSMPTTGNPQIMFRGLKIDFTATPKSNDSFTVDGNQDGIGSNDNLLKLVALENAKVMPNNLTMTESYIESVNQVGNIAKQADISKQALTVVNTQAQQAHDSISGVSLDEEASSLVKFQQSYQANAKVMQIASQLFDTILGVR